MNAEQYNKWSRPLRENPQRLRAVALANKALTYVYYVAYPLLVAYLFISGDSFALPALACPMVGFAVVTVMRIVINKPRPYEALDIVSVIPKDTKGKSFPSRHSYSAIAIATTFLLWCPPLGVIMIVLGLCMIVVRVLGGVHYPIDVAAGFALGVLFGLLELLF